MNIRELEERLSYYPPETEVRFLRGTTLEFSHVVDRPGGTEDDYKVLLELCNKEANGTINSESLVMPDTVTVGREELDAFWDVYRAARVWRGQLGFVETGSPGNPEGAREVLEEYKQRLINSVDAVFNRRQA